MVASESSVTVASSGIRMTSISLGTPLGSQLPALLTQRIDNAALVCYVSCYRDTSVILELKRKDCACTSSSFPSPFPATILSRSDPHSNVVIAKPKRRRASRASDDGHHGALWLRLVRARQRQKVQRDAVTQDKLFKLVKGQVPLGSCAAVNSRRSSSVNGIHKRGEEYRDGWERACQ